MILVMKMNLIGNKIVVRNKRNWRGIGFYVARPSILGNPYSHLDISLAKFKVSTVDEAILKYKKYFHLHILTDNKFRDELLRMVSFYNENKFLNIICWCNPKPCHGDVIKEYIQDIVELT